MMAVHQKDKLSRLIHALVYPQCVSNVEMDLYKNLKNVTMETLKVLTGAQLNVRLSLDLNVVKKLHQNVFQYVGMGD